MAPPLGATLRLGEVNFSLYSAIAEEVWILLFNRSDADPTDVIRVETGPVRLARLLPRRRRRPALRVHLVLNGDYRQREVMVPPLPSGFRWRRAIDTSLPAGEEFAKHGEEPPLSPADRYLVNPRTTVVKIGI